MGKPKIRFKGYEDDWEQRKLDGWGTFYYGRSCPKWSVTEDATIPCIRYGELYTKFGAKIDRVYSYTNMPPENLRFSKGTEVLIPRVGEDPMDYNHCTWLSMPDVAIGEMISVFNTDNNPLFTATMFNATLQNEFAMRVEGGSVTNLYFEKLKNIEVSFPSIQEQEKIAAYFENLDHLITLHQRKCEETKSLKKYMLQKMFPENGKCVPKIRFSGFSDAWEQRKLSEITIETYGGGTPKTANEEFWKGDIPWIQSSDLVEECLFDVKPRKSISQEAVSKSATKLVPQNSIAIVTRVGVGKLAFMPFSYATSQDFLSISELKTAPEFTVYALYRMMQLVSNEVQGTSIKGITKDELLAKKMLIPSRNEQKKIGTYLHIIDHLITLHQHKCDELQKLKKFMLQNMFV